MRDDVIYTMSYEIASPPYLGIRGDGSQRQARIYQNCLCEESDPEPVEWADDEAISPE